ncbi:hypothetical protein GCM10008012_49650 [Rhizobium anhuiense]|nr:hypothetical protein GCM10008012_49650 [Rhizobium anhuiense]
MHKNQKLTPDELEDKHADRHLDLPHGATGNGEYPARPDDNSVDQAPDDETYRKPGQVIRDIDLQYLGIKHTETKNHHSHGKCQPQRAYDRAAVLRLYLSPAQV